MNRFSFLLLLLITGGSALPPGFEHEQFITGLKDPDAMAFAPDGRLFVAERIEGKLRVVDTNGTLMAEEFLKCNVPAARHRSSGLRGIAFHPDYPSTPWVYVFYMQDTPRFNRVSRFTTDPENPNRALAGSEEVLLELPANETGATGSHNGGAIIFGSDNKLYITTGDGWQNWETWDEGDPVQSLSSFTGKLLRINDDGGIPEDNPFFNTAEGAYRAIYALGFRNPYTISLHPETGDLYVADVVGNQKDVVHKIVAGGNYKYEQSGSWNQNIGSGQDPWANTGSQIISGGTWYSGNSWPTDYQGSYFATSWAKMNITRFLSKDDPEKSVFEESTPGAGGGPAYIAMNPKDGNLYWLSTNYETDAGEVRRIVYKDNTTIRKVSKPQQAVFSIRHTGSRLEILVESEKRTSGNLTLRDITGKVQLSQPFTAENRFRWDIKKELKGVFILDVKTPSARQSSKLIFH